jgi:hypothetical protein
LFADDVELRQHRAVEAAKRATAIGDSEPQAMPQQKEKETEKLRTISHESVDHAEAASIPVSVIMPEKPKSLFEQIEAPKVSFA